jgi:UPF0755 protein
MNSRVKKSLHLQINFLFFLLFFIIIVFLCRSRYDESNISPEDSLVQVFIPQGISYTQALTILKKNGIINHTFLLKVLARLTKTDRKLSVGYYLFKKNSSIYDIFYKLKKGDVLMTSVTVLEGETLLDICQKIADNDSMRDECLRLTHDREFIKSLNLNVPNLEGYLYPETYFFIKGASIHTIIKTMVKELRKKLTHDVLAHSQELGMNEIELLTLASIIEKEAADDKERKLISAVFHNRLKIGMPLQSDPTAVYGIDKDDSYVAHEDIIRYTEYNTYYIKGLPPGPIASPGIKSILAALYPAPVDYLYFVSKQDGTHYFSITYKEHLRAVNKYLK